MCLGIPEFMLNRVLKSTLHFFPPVPRMLGFLEKGDGTVPEAASVPCSPCARMKGAPALVMGAPVCGGPGSSDHRCLERTSGAFENIQYHQRHWKVNEYLLSAFSNNGSVHPIKGVKKIARRL